MARTTQPAAPPPAAGPTQAPIKEETALPLLQQRRAHYKDLYFKMEDRAQFFAGILLAAGAAFLSGVKTHLLDPPTPLSDAPTWILGLTLVAAILLLVSLLGVFMTLSPLRGRMLFRGDDVDWLERWTVSIAQFPSGWANGAEKFLDKQDAANMPGFLASIFKDSAKGFPPLRSSVIFDDEVHNLRAQWFAYMRRALLLRKTVFISTVALLVTGVTYLSFPPAPVEGAAATKASATEARPGAAQPARPNQRSAQRHRRARAAPADAPVDPASTSTTPPPADGSPAPAPTSAPAATPTGSP